MAACACISINGNAHSILSPSSTRPGGFLDDFGTSDTLADKSEEKSWLTWYLNYSEGPTIWLGDNSKEVHLPVCVCDERLAGCVRVQIGALLGGAPASLGGVCVGGIGALAGK
ncbi:uncharacterized, partial [Tachysurus ichikawai]